MKLLENTKFTGAALLLLLALNSTLLVVLIFKHPGHPPRFAMMPPREIPDEGPKNYLIHELNFSDDQQKKFETLVDDHRKKANEIQEQIHAMRDSMVHQLESQNPDTTIINSLSGKIGVEQSELEKNTFHHFLEVKAICDPAQQKKFSEIIGNALQMLAPPRGPHPPPAPMGN